MPVTRRTPLSPLSAALTMVAWVQTHGRPPRCTECVGQEGLHWYATYYDAFALSSWSAILDEASALTQGWCLSGLRVSATALKRCLNAPQCSNLIPDEGPGIRFCRACQQAMRQEVAFIEPLVSPQRWRRWGVHDIEGDSWMDDIDWSG